MIGRRPVEFIVALLIFVKGRLLVIHMCMNLVLNKQHQNWCNTIEKQKLIRREC